MLCISWNIGNAQEMLAILMTVTAILYAEGEVQNNEWKCELWRLGWEVQEAHPCFPPSNLYTAKWFVLF